MNFPWFSIVMATVLVASANTAIARTITAYSFDLVLPIAVNTPVPNNDNTIVQSPDQISVGTFIPTEFYFLVEPSGGTTEYFFSETVINTSPSTWTDFHFELGFGVGSNFRSFLDIPHPSLRALPDFDTPSQDPTPTSTKFTNLVHQPA